MFLGLFIGCWTFATHADDMGKAWVNKAYHRKDSKTSLQLLKMTIKPKKGSVRTRQLYIFRERLKPTEISALIRFVTPEDVKNTGMLTNDKTGDNVDQWIYLPALKKVRRISSSRKGGRFVSSHFYYEDLRDREPDQDVHTFRGLQNLNGVKAAVVESIPIDASNSTYKKKVVWIHPQTNIVMQVDFYENDKKSPTKRLSVKKIEKVQDIWTVMLAEMTDLKTGGLTQLEVQKVKHNLKLPAGVFTTQTLEDPSREEKYRRF